MNTTAIGDYRNPTVRFTGSGGNPDIKSLAGRTVFIMAQEKRRFKETVDFIPSPGWRVKQWPGGEWVSLRKAFGSAFRGGPVAVITDMAVFRFDEETGEMYLHTVHAGFTEKDVQEKVGLKLDVSRCTGETESPTYLALSLLNHVIDPEKLVLD